MTTMPVSEVVFRQDLYPRLAHDPALVQRYQDNLEVLPWGVSKLVLNPLDNLNRIVYTVVIVIDLAGAAKRRWM